MLRFQKDLRPHLSFSYRFRPSTLQRLNRLKTLLYPQCAYSNELDSCTFQYIGPGILAPFSTLCWRPVESIWMTSPFSDSIVSPPTQENSIFKKHVFQIAPLWRAFSNDSVFGDRFRRCSVDDSRIRSKTGPLSFENGSVWTGPKYLSKN